jgi:HlyD family secretion protein
MKKKRRIIIPVLVLVILGSIASWYFTRGEPVSAFDSITASGTIEAVEIEISPEMPGRVVEVAADKGESVSRGDVLITLDDELLTAQRNQILAAADAARANIKSAEKSVSAAEAARNLAETNLQAVRKSVTAQALPLHQGLQDLYDNHELSKSEASAEVAEANRAVRDAQYQLDNFTVPVHMTAFTPFSAVKYFEQQLTFAREAFEPHKYKSSGDPVREARQGELDDAQSDFDTAVKWMEYEALVASTLSRREKAIQDLEQLQDGPDPEEIDVLEARIEAIEVAVNQASAEVDRAQTGVDHANAVLEQSRELEAKTLAELKMVDIQLSRQKVIAPDSGVVLSRNIQPGEFAQAGASLMKIGTLDDLTITVFVSEENYGQISLGDHVVVSVDSFPGEKFSAQVIHIADRAEFTPRNVQTPEGRKTTVFAVELSVLDDNGKLKPGMPADVKFGGF